MHSVTCHCKTLRDWLRSRRVSICVLQPACPLCQLLLDGLFSTPHAMSSLAAKPPVTVRLFRPADAHAVRIFWAAGFLELPLEMTQTLGPVLPSGPGGPVFRAPRPLLFAAASVGAVRCALSLTTGERPGRGALLALLLGAGGLAALQASTALVIRQMVDEECAAGDMADIAASWQCVGRQFFVAEVNGLVVGSVAVRLGGVLDTPSPQSDAPAGSEVLASVWKVSTNKAHRGLGVAYELMAAAEQWASDAGASKMVLVTGSRGAKLFYARIGYELTSPPGSRRGTEISYWAKPLTKGKQE